MKTNVKGSGNYKKLGIQKKGTFKIYVLLDENNEIQYVGMTKQYLCQRLAYHVYSSVTLNNGSVKSEWIRSMVERGLRPRIELIEMLPGISNTEAYQKEMKYINLFGVVNTTYNCKNKKVWIN